MILHLQRERPNGETLHGLLTVNGVTECFTLERASRSIPAGRYRVGLQAPAHEGILWSPRPTHELPLIHEVPGRVGIFMHAANKPEELQGCIAVGTTMTLDGLSESRRALSALLRAMDDDPSECWITVEDAP